MESIVIMPEYLNAVQAIKLAILESRYRAARLVNKEMLALYYAVGEYISRQSRTAKWGINAIGTISLLLQQELPGLRGFSETNIKRMRLFYEAWRELFENRPPVADELADNSIISTDSQGIVIRPLIADELSPDDMNDSLSVGFTHHSEILARAKDLNQRMFYIKQCAVGFWSKEKLIYYLKDGLYEKQGRMPNNFTATISDIDLRQRALRPFKDEYFLDFVNIEDPDEIDEGCLEQQIVHNIKNFIMALGNDFSFIGNQYRLVVEGKEYFIDLLFFNRNLQSLVAIELKTGEFKPEYAGKLNLKLSDDIAFRFSNSAWDEYPLTAEKYVSWLNAIDSNEEVINLFMDYETFGEHQWKETGIFDFMRALPEKVFKYSDYQFHTPSEVVAKHNPVGVLNVPYSISWADEERDLTAWLGNELQNEAFENLYKLFERVKELDDPELWRDWLYLQTSDHFYYMCTKWFSDGDVHKYFNPYSSPYEAFINYMNILSDFRIRLGL